MKCKKHPLDDSSSAGVCASCLRQRLLVLVAAQAAQGNHFREDEKNIFPLSVSPYISRRKLDTAPVTGDRKFFSTPQIGPARKVVVDEENYMHTKKGFKKFWLISSWFRSKSSISNNDLDPKTNSSWFSSILYKRKKISCSLDKSTSRVHGRNHGNCRGMSPAICSDEEEDDKRCTAETTGKHCSAETSGCNTEELKQTPRRTPGRNGGGRRRQLTRNLSDIVFCLSPLVRPSPNRIWNQKGGIPPEMGVSGHSGEARVHVKPCNNITASFCKNRSRKLADFGRGNRNH